MKWEYAVETESEDHLLAALQKRGRESWELVSASYYLAVNKQEQSASPMYMLVYKRPYLQGDRDQRMLAEFGMAR